MGDNTTSPSPPKVLHEDQKRVIAAEVAHLTARLFSKEQISQQMGISKRQVNNAMKHPEYKKAMDEIISSGKNKARGFLALRAETYLNLAHEALISNLRDGRMEAVKVVLETLGVKDKDDGDKKEAPVHVHFPAELRPPEKVVKSEVEE